MDKAYLIDFDESKDLRWIVLEDVRIYSNEETLLKMAEKTKAANLNSCLSRLLC